MKTKLSALEIIKKFQLFIFLAVVVIVMGIMKPGMFFTSGFFINVLLTIAVYGIMVCGTIFVVIRGAIDLSVARITALSGTILVMHILAHGRSDEAVLGGVILAIAVSVLLGIGNGILVEFTTMPPMIVTLATQRIISAGNQLYIKNQTLVMNDPPRFIAISNRKILGIPSIIYIFFACILISYFVLNHTTFGRRVYAVGGNRKAARYSGVNDRITGIAVYACSGLTAGIAGVVLASFTQQAVYFAADG